MMATSTFTHVSPELLINEGTSCKVLKVSGKRGGRAEGGGGGGGLG